jgi:heme-degrading monooxygenase HmoA
VYARLITVRGATKIDETVDFIRENVVPDLRQQKGFESINLAGNRSAGTFTVLTVWQTEADRDSSEGFSEKARNEALKILGGELAVDHFEETVREVGSTPPAPGAKLQVRSIKMDPAKVDENLAFFKETVLPDIKSTPGFMAVRHMINRRTGEGRVGTVWVDEPSWKAALQKADERRALGTSRGVEFGEDLTLEILFRA